MAYPTLNSSNISTDLTQILVYANTVTHEWFAPLMVLSFFLVVLIGSIFAQLRISGRVEPETSLLASLFATLGFSAILQQTSGILSPIYFYMIIGFTVLAFIWVAMTSNR